MRQVGDAEGVQSPLQRRADAREQAHGRGGEDIARIGAEHGESARLVPSGRDLGQQPVRREPD